MKKKYLLDLLLCISIVLASCGEKKTKVKVLQANLVSKKEIPSFSDFKVIQTKSLEGFKAGLINVDTATFKNGIYGILATFEVEVDKNCLDNCFKQAFDCFYYNVSYGSNEKDCIPDLSNLKEAKFSNLNTDPLIKDAGLRRFSMHIPYRKIKAKSGLNQLYLSLRIYPAKFCKDKTMKTLQVLKKINDSEHASVLYAVSFKSPEMKNIVATVAGFAIDSIKVNAKRFDFGVTGNGYPDLIWQLQCGDDIIFTSPVKKNTLSYKTTLSSPSFNVCYKDSLKLTFADYDNALTMNKNDIISTWSGSTRSALEFFANLTDLRLNKLSSCNIKFVERKESIVKLNHRH